MTKKLALYLGLMICLALPLFGQQPNNPPKPENKGTKKPNIIRLGSFEKEKGLVAQLYQVNPAQSGALKSFLSKWLTPKGNIEEYEDLRLLEVTDTKENLVRINSLLGTIDKPDPQILIEARITEITTDSGLDLGIEVPYGTNPPGMRATYGTGSSVYSPEAYLKSVATGNTFEGGTAIFSRKDHLFRLDAMLRALQTKGIAKIISTPQILTVNGQEALISAGQSFPYIASLTPSGTGVTASTAYMDVAIKLSVTPFFIGDDVIELVITPEVSVVTGWQQIQSGVSLPVIAKRSAFTRVNVKNGETVAIGGLLKEEKLSSEKKFPILGSIPILGYLFTSHHSTTANTNLVFFITPRLIKPNEEVNTPEEEEKETKDDKKDKESKNKKENKEDKKEEKKQ
jgi:type II secretory pathway component GspD/PulD (secretin)